MAAKKVSAKRAFQAFLCSKYQARAVISLWDYACA